MPLNISSALYVHEFKKYFVYFVFIGHFCPTLNECLMFPFHSKNSFWLKFEIKYQFFNQRGAD